MLASLAAIALALLSGCSPQRPWAEKAVQWIEARDRAAHRSVAELMMFDSADSVHLLCCNQAGPIQGRVENAEFIAQNFGDTFDEETMGRSYIDVSGAVAEIRFRAGPDDDRPAGGGDPLGANELQVWENAADGTATRTIHAMALPFLESPVDDGRAWYANNLRAVQKLTDRHLSAWSGPDGRVVGDLYAENATLLDSLLGVSSHPRAHGRAGRVVEQHTEDVCRSAQRTVTVTFPVARRSSSSATAAPASASAWAVPSGGSSRPSASSGRTSSHWERT